MSGNIILSLGMLMVVVSGCGTCVDLTPQHCQICYNDCSGDFVSCTHTVCVSRDGDNCIDYQTEHLSLEQCFRNCCGLQVRQEFSKEGVEKCKQAKVSYDEYNYDSDYYYQNDYNNNYDSGSSSGGESAGIGAGVSIVVICLLCCCCYQKRKRQFVVVQVYD